MPHGKSSTERIKMLESHVYKGEAISRLDLLWLLDIAQESSTLATSLDRDRQSADCVRVAARRVSAMLEAGPKAHLEARDAILDDNGS